MVIQASFIEYELTLISMVIEIKPLKICYNSYLFAGCGKTCIQFNKQQKFRFQSVNVGNRLFHRNETNLYFSMLFSIMIILSLTDI